MISPPDLLGMPLRLVLTKLDTVEGTQVQVAELVVLRLDC